jgi:hypothetical protein
MLGWVNLNLVRAKHSGSKSIVITNKLSAGMLRPYEYIRKIPDVPVGFRYRLTQHKYQISTIN